MLEAGGVVLFDPMSKGHPKEGDAGSAATLAVDGSTPRERSAAVRAVARRDILASSRSCNSGLASISRCRCRARTNRAAKIWTAAWSSA